MVDAKIDIFEMSYQEHVAYLKNLENLEKMRRTNGPGPNTIPIGSKKRVSVKNSVGKSSKNPNSSRIQCKYSDKTKHWSMLRGKSQITIVINFRLFLEFDLVCHIGMC
jgi:hypothetical protein